MNVLALFSCNWVIPPFLKGFKEGDLIHGAIGLYASDDGRKATDFGGLFRLSLVFCLT